MRKRKKPAMFCGPRKESNLHNLRCLELFDRGIPVGQESAIAAWFLGSMIQTIFVFVLGVLVAREIDEKAIDRVEWWYV
jgi:hypothetical protein